MTRPISEYREALQLLIDVATGRSERAIMSIPARPNHDADLLLSAALDELSEAREHVRVLTEALETYGEHKSNCRLEGWSLALNRPCDCGFDDALRSTQPKEGQGNG